MKLLLSSLFFCLSTSLLWAQTTPEVCARLLLGLGQDSVSWQATPCANFGGYVVLRQPSSGGNFVPIDTTNFSETVQANPTEDSWNYQIGMLCNGVLSNLSNTASNERPSTPDILHVNIVSGQPFIRWNPSASPTVTGYQLYREQPYNSGNFFPYPNASTILNSTSYLDTGATTLLVRYALVAVSDCNKSLLGLGNAIDGTTGPHSSMVAQATIDSCNQSIALNWNAYENWADGVQQYEIWLSTNGAASRPIDTVSASTNSYLYTGAQDNDVLIFQIRAIERNQSNQARSNNLRLDIRVNRPMDFLFISDLTVRPDNSISLSWEWDIDVDFTSGDLLRAEGEGTQEVRLNLPVVGSIFNNFIDTDASPQQQAYTYQVTSLDACEQRVNSLTARTVFLEVEAAENFQNKLTWQPAEIGDARIQSYDVYKDVGGSALLLANVPASSLSFTDNLDVRNEGDAEACYWVVANLELPIPTTGLWRFIQSQSNRACAVQTSSMQVPNAVSPNGENRFFRPLVAFSRSIFNYSMQIYDRYGQEIFLTNDVYEGWDGTQNGQPLRLGMYVYLIRFQAPNGTWIERRGTVMLIR